MLIPWYLAAAYDWYEPFETGQAGDLFVMTGPDTVVKHNIGSQGQMLRVNTANPQQVEWGRGAGPPAARIMAANSSDLAVPAGFADMTGVSVTFTQPPGFNAALVELTAYVDVLLLTVGVQWRYNDGSSTYGTSQVLNAAGSGRPVHYRHLNTSVAEGEHTFQFEHTATVALRASLKQDGANGYFIVASVTPAIVGS